MCGTRHASAVTEGSSQTRGPFDEDNEPKFCGGVTAVNTTRQPFPLNNGIIQIDALHDTSIVTAFVSLSPNPTAFTDFSATLLFNFTNLVGQHEFCLNVNPSTSGIPGIADGVNATIQVQVSRALLHLQQDGQSSSFFSV